MVSYRVLFDFDRDGYVHRTTAQADPINLLPSPVQFRGLHFAANASTTLSLVREATTYGVFILRAVMAAASGTGFSVGVHPSGAINVIPVTAGQTYTWRVWTKSPTLTGDTDFLLKVFDQAGNEIAASSVLYPETYWVAQTLTFTAGVGMTHARLAVLKSPPNDALTLDTAGWMLVAGSSAPSAFNAGGIHWRDNITTAIREIEFSDGMERAYIGMPTPARALLTLNNLSGDWLPENSSSELFGHLSKGLLIFIEADHLGVTYPLWRGTIAGVEISPDDAEPVARLVAEDGMSIINQATYEPPLLLDVTTGEALTHLFDSGAIRYPYPGEFAIIDGGDYAKIDEARIFENVITSFEDGQTQLAYVGDNLERGAGVGVQSYIAALVGAECGGRFFYDGTDGRYKFHDRHRDFLRAGSYTDLGRDELTNMSYVWGDDLANDITINYAPRRVGSAGSVMYSMENLPLRLAAGQSRSFTAAYRNGDSASAVGGIDMIRPVAGTDYAAESEVLKNNEGAPTDRTERLLVRVQFGATSANVTVMNTGGEAVNVTLFRLRGTPLISDSRATVTARDPVSIGDHGIHGITLDLPALADGEFAQHYADWLIHKFSQPIGHIASVMVLANKSDTTMTKALGFAVGDAVSIADDYLTNTQETYIIVGRTHQINVGTQPETLLLTLVLQPVERQKVAIVDDPESLIDSAIIAF